MESMIRTVLVANRGEIARRIFRTCVEMGIRTVAVYSDADVDAPFVADADVAVHLGPSEPSMSYLDIDKVIAAARRTNADAIHPGYGFLSENASFAEACAKANIIFVGPSPEAITAMGSKLESKRIMAEANVPTLPSVAIGADTDTLAAAADIGYPVLVKASAGGGGKGMRVVESPDSIATAVQGAIREATAAFGDGTVFLEKYLIGPRHIEVQVFGDANGTVISLGERECSIQRRHQKIIEEAPSPSVDADLRARLSAAAIQAAEAVSYVGAGTVEFLVDAEGAFFFLEMNTRLQVEHPVTEMVTGVDLVRLQIEVAEGLSLNDAGRNVQPVGHAIEARVYAEDPTNDFLPATGTIRLFDLPTSVRVDSGVIGGSEVSIFYDPMLAKVVAHGTRRSDAIRVLVSALRASRIHGVLTNVPLLVRILEHADFVQGQADTGWLESLDVAALGRPLTTPEDVEHMALAASLVLQARRRAEACVLTTLPSGFRNNPSQLTIDNYASDDRTIGIGYLVTAGEIVYTVDGEQKAPATLVYANAHSVRFRIDEIDRVFSVATSSHRVFIDTADASAELTRMPRLPIPEVAIDPGSLLSPMPGRVVRLEVSVGDSVSSGDALVVVEAMKMEHTISAPHDGTVSSLPVAAGDQVEADEVLAVVDPVDKER